jgi:hypothetical protein
MAAATTFLGFMIHLVRSRGTDRRSNGLVPATTYADGRLAVSRSRCARLVTGRSARGIVAAAVDVGSGTARAIVIAASPDEGNLGNPQWSAEGTRILFTRLVDVGGGQTKANLFQMRPDGTDVIQVIKGLEDDYPADWGTYPLVN